MMIKKQQQNKTKFVLCIFGAYQIERVMVGDNQFVKNVQME